MPELVYLQEPKLLFGYEQAVEDPRDGLALFGPLDAGKPYGIRAGVIGTRDGLRRFRNWVQKIQGPVLETPPSLSRPPFPGFESVFSIPWKPEPTLEMEIPEDELSGALFLDDKYVRVYKTVDVYSKRLIEAIKEEDTSVDIWFIVIPDDVYRYGRPNSRVDPQVSIKASDRLSPNYAKRMLIQSPLFPEDYALAQPYHYDVHFHNQLKARLLGYNAPTQVVRESTIAQWEFLDRYGRPLRDLDVPSAIAWNVSATTFYKAGGRPWKLAAIRRGVCYVGLAFKVDEKLGDPRSACCAAQMFLDSGDGVVFRGAVGPWYNPKRGEFHLSREAARELIRMSLESYNEIVGSPPSELFLHGKVRFDDEEWAGFREAAEASISLVGVRIRSDSGLKLYRKGEYPVLRGLAYIQDERIAYLWTKGFIPRLQTYPGREVPWPLLIDVCRGDGDIRVVLKDIMALTKLNYNTCIYADGLPVTLRFADAVGEILTAGPLDAMPPLSFKNYI